MRWSRIVLGIAGALITACAASGANDAGPGMDSHVDTTQVDTNVASGPEDAWVCNDWVVWGCTPPPHQPPPDQFVAPTVPCDGDAAAGDPCAHWVDCVPVDRDAAYPWGAWAVTWSNGSCTSGSCVFTSVPSAEFCYGGCSYHTGIYGRCTNPGPTAP